MVRMRAAASAEAGVHKGAIDANLRFPAGDPGWQAFLAHERLSVTTTGDLASVSDALQRHELDFCYMASAYDCVLRGDSRYVGLASACSLRTRRPALASVMVVARDNPAMSWHALQGARLGYVNTFCTTSYFAPSILLAHEGRMLDAFFDAFPVAPWQGQIDAVIAGTIDVTMVFEDVWLARPENARRTRVIDRLDDLPTPVFITRSDDRDGFAARLKSRLMTLPASSAPNALYGGFTSYQEARMSRFFDEVERIPGMPKAFAHV
jgi:phosphonate transport system substrate-binding protein